MKKYLIVFAAAIACIISLSQCKKDLAPSVISTDSTHNNDLTTKIMSSVSGFVADENNMPVAGASVVSGGLSTTTDQFGYFEISDVLLIKNAAFVTVTMPGYFNAVKTWIAEIDEQAFFRVKLLPKTLSGSINSTTGGTVTLTDGFSILFPADAFVTASSGAAYSGTVNVSAQHLDPTATTFYNSMPGDLRGKDSTGGLKVLTSYGISATELTGASGELLQIAPGKKATITCPIPGALSANAPATLPLWYFDETAGLWKLQGNAVRTGNSYVGDVNHFSFWSAAVPFNYVEFTVIVEDNGGDAVQNALVSLKNNNDSSIRNYYTGGRGYISGAIPSNAQVTLQVKAGFSCPFVLQTQDFSTSTTNISIATISLISNRTAKLTGNIANCTNGVVANGHVLLTFDSSVVMVSSDSAGLFTVALPVCEGDSLYAVVTGIDNVNNVLGIPSNVALAAGSITSMPVSACATNTAEFLDYQIEGVPHSYYAAADDTISYDASAGPANYLVNTYKLNASDYPSAFEIPATGLFVGAVVQLPYFASQEFDYTGPTNNTGFFYATITEYGPIGAYISGTFSGTVTTSATSTPPNQPYQLTGSFRIKRNY